MLSGYNGFIGFEMTCFDAEAQPILSTSSNKYEGINEKTINVSWATS